MACFMWYQICERFPLLSVFNNYFIMLNASIWHVLCGTKYMNFNYSHNFVMVIATFCLDTYVDFI